jgi:hypothetical protein
VSTYKKNNNDSLREREAQRGRDRDVVEEAHELKRGFRERERA